MTTPIEALELKPCPFCGGEAESDSARYYRSISTGTPEKAAAIYCTSCSADMTWCYRDTPEIERDQVMTLLIEQWNTRATPSLEGDAVERVARIIDPQAWRDRDYYDDYRRLPASEHHATKSSITKARAILATGLVAGEARVAEVMEEAGEEGAAAGWRPCSGCHETEDGRPVGKYPYSSLFKCDTGAGCHECGGLGVVWEYHSARDLAFLEQQLSEPEPLNESAIRADEREKCEHRVEELDCLYINDERCPFGGIPADPETSIRREAIKECLAAIRSGDVA